MGRELRRVPPDWEHPKDERGEYIPLFDETFEQAAADWKREFLEWESGVRPDFDLEKHPNEYEFWEWDSEPPCRDQYRPQFTSEPTHYQMYENVTEGTPISPVFADLETLCRWLADHGADAGFGRIATYDQWLSMCRGGGYAPTMVISGGHVMSGVEAEDLKKG